MFEDGLYLIYEIEIFIKKYSLRIIFEYGGFFESDVSRISG